jgi:hypothetical protein
MAGALTRAGPTQISLENDGKGVNMFLTLRVHLGGKGVIILH